MCCISSADGAGPRELPAAMEPRELLTAVLAGQERRCARCTACDGDPETLEYCPSARDKTT